MTQTSKVPDSVEFLNTIGKHTFGSSFTPEDFQFLWQEASSPRRYLRNFYDSSQHCPGQSHHYYGLDHPITQAYISLSKKWSKAHKKSINSLGMFVDFSVNVADFLRGQKQFEADLDDAIDYATSFANSTYDYRVSKKHRVLFNKASKKDDSSTKHLLFLHVKPVLLIHSYSGYGNKYIPMLPLLGRSISSGSGRSLARNNKVLKKVFGKLARNATPEELDFLWLLLTKIPYAGSPEQFTTAANLAYLVCPAFLECGGSAPREGNYMAFTKSKFNIFSGYGSPPNDDDEWYMLSSRICMHSINTEDSISHEYNPYMSGIWDIKSYLLKVMKEVRYSGY